MNIKERFGKNLKFYRLQKQMTQQDLSEIVGISLKHISAMERGLAFVSAGTLEKLADALGVDASRFFERRSAAPQKRKLVQTVKSVKGKRKQQ